eukprot:jgi/Chrzof1/4104/UNPLg00765.t1
MIHNDDTVRLQRARHHQARDMTVNSHSSSVARQLQNIDCFEAMPVRRLCAFLHPSGLVRDLVSCAERLSRLLSFAIPMTRLLVVAYYMALAIHAGRDVAVLQLTNKYCTGSGASLICKYVASRHTMDDF